MGTAMVVEVINPRETMRHFAEQQDQRAQLAGYGWRWRPLCGRGRDCLEVDGDIARMLSDSTHARWARVPMCKVCQRKVDGREVETP